MMQQGPKGKSLFLLNRRSRFRDFCAKLISHKIFDPFILFIITASTVTLALDNPLNDPKGTMTAALQIIDQFFTAIFVLEAVCKILAFGLLLNGKNSYLRNPWNSLDFIILGFSLVSVVPNDKIDFKFMKAIRMLRVVRPLRVISRNQGLRIAVLSLLNSILGIFHVFTISILFFLLFGIFGINYFKGTFFKCHQEHIPNTIFIITTKWDCINLGGEWINQDQNFDNILNGIKTLFEMSSTEGWTDVMWAGVDASEIDSVPIESNRPLWVIFFMAFLLFGSLFIMNLFVGVVINTFNDEREKLGKNHLLTTFQREWIMIQISLLKLKPQSKQERFYKSKIRNFISIISYSQRFEFFILTCIILNTICFAIEWYNQPQDVNNVLEIINYVFAAIFTFETVIKLIALGYKDYFNNGWNIFDMMVVIGTITSVFLTVFTSTTFGASTTLIRTFRIGRVLRIISKASFLKKIFNTFLVTIPSLANIGGLLALLLYIFSILGIFLFADVKLQTNLDQHANFQNFYTAFLTLVRCATGESWNYIMNDCARTSTILFDCKNDPSYSDYVNNGEVTLGCGDPTQAYAFFMSFTMLVSMIFLNLFIAIILESFENVNQQEDLKIKDKDLDSFQKVWLPYDPKGTGFIDIQKFEDLLLELVEQKSEFIREGELLKLDSLARRHFIEELELPTYSRMSVYHYADILHSLSKAALQIDLIQGNYYTTENDDAKSQTSKNTSQKKEFNQLSMNLIIDQEIININTMNETQKIQLVEEYTRLRIKTDDTKRKYLDQFEGNIYNSRFVFLLQQMKARIRFWIIRRRKQKEIEQKLKLNLAERMTKNLMLVTIDPKTNQQSTDNIINSLQLDMSQRIEDSVENNQLKLISSSRELSEEDSESIEILNGTGNEESLKDAKTQLKISRQKRQQELIFAKQRNSNVMSTFDTDLNSLIKQLSGNQDTLNSGNLSLRDSEHSDEKQEIIFNRKSDVSRQVLADKGWFKQLPNTLNTIISEMRQEESLSTSRILQKSSDDVSGNNQGGSPIESQNAHTGQQIQNFFTNQKLVESKQQSSDNLVSLISNARSDDDLIQNSQTNPLINCMTEENHDGNPLQNNLKQQQLTVSFGLSDNQAEDFSDVRIFNFQENLKSSEKSNEKPIFDEDSQTQLNQNKDSPKFISSKIQNFKLDSQRIKNSKTLGGKIATVNLRKKLSKLIKTKDEIQRQETFKNKISELIKKPSIKIQAEQNLKLKQRSQFEHYQAKQEENTIVIASIYTDQSDSSRQKFDSSMSVASSLL
ncbi:voltage-gated ion channel superfamily [Stylonychia lemnae]|uniref:Voltage-gated ion channel superfamily n=1 Tax=Stylonychia lemnae TaxID=5949 RepID=A0A078AL68_STYLE|nr:voltage-gated ion channel superfamily [Stylonychia lemnae]|eukprot:CDW82939.1 voltage-gated ion channel superfamily [Stylonychia lemnae]